LVATFREEHRLRVWHVWVADVARMEERGEAYTGFWWGNLKERDH
jgi:hypothetical protein